MADTNHQQIYEELGYRSQPFPYTSIGFLESYGTLWGYEVADAETARVLEIGSSYGGNIISQAAFYPKAEFIGIELSHHQVEVGNRCIENSGLSNVKLLAGDVKALPALDGEFDYIIAHGVYSWVDDAAKEALMQLAADKLSAKGLFYVSYNTYPGWHTMDEVRNLLLFANRKTEGLTHKERVMRGKVMASKVGSQILTYDDLTKRKGRFLGALRSILQKDDYYIGHDHLEPHNDPVYFYEMADQAAVHGLTYVGDADLTLSLPRYYDEGLADKLDELARGDQVDGEQYLDFIADTPFRKSLFGKSNKARYDLHQVNGEVPQALRQVLDGFTYQIVFEKSFIEAMDDMKLRKALLEILGEGTYFTTYDVKGKLPTDKVDDLYHWVLKHIVQGGLRYMNVMRGVGFEDLKTYVPERYRRAYEAILEFGHDAIFAGTIYNETIVDLNEEDVEFMKLLYKPTTKASIINELMKIFSANAGSETVQNGTRNMAEAYYKELMKRMDYFGVLTYAHSN